MPIETICQGCARKLRVPDEHAGKKARCPQCGMIYIVPASPDAVTASSDAADDDDAAAAARSPNLQETIYVDRKEESGERETGRWQVRTSDGRVYGPVPRSELDEWYAEGRIPGDAMLLPEGDPQWRRASEIFAELAGGHKGISRQHNPFAERVASTPFRSQPFRHRIPHRGGLILTLAILGWAFCPVFGPFAWAMGSSDMRAMRNGTMDPGGMSLTQAGMVLGIIQTVLMFIAMAFVCLGALR